MVIPLGPDHSVLEGISALKEGYAWFYSGGLTVLQGTL